MSELSNTYKAVQAPPRLQTRLLDDYARRRPRAVPWLAPAAALMVLFAASIAVLQQPAPSTQNMPASAPPSISGVRLAGLTPATSSLSQLTLSRLRLPPNTTLVAIPSMPSMPKAPAANVRQSRNLTRSREDA